MFLAQWDGTLPLSRNFNVHGCMGLIYAIFDSFPVTSVTAERSFSSPRFMKIYLGAQWHPNISTDSVAKKHH